MTEETKTEKDIQELIDLAFSAVVQTSVELEDDQLDALENLNQYCVNAALHNPEVIKKPLKVVYKTNEGLKEALVAICLAYSLVNPRRKLRENKEFFDKNITIYQRPGNVKFIDFGEIAPDSVQAAVYWDIIEDWKLYIDRECGGIKALVDEKTNLAGLDNYIRGGDPLYEFARFHRKYTEKNEAPGRKKQNFRTGRFPQCRRSVGGNRSDQTAAARRQKPDGNHRLAVKSGCLLPAGNRTQAARAASNRLSESGTPFKRPPAVP